MITKTEVARAIAIAENAGGWGPLDESPVRVSKGTLHILAEAAKTAHYKNTGGCINEPPSDSDLILIEKPQKISDDEESDEDE